MNFLKAAVPALKAVGRATGVVGAYDTGIPVKGRKKRLTASLVALGTALGVWVGLPEPVAEALAEILVELGVQAAE